MDTTAKYASTSFLVLAVVAPLILPMPAEALMPYAPRSFWEMILPPEDPFRILEQSPLTIPKGVETLALARADWKETTKEHAISLDIPGIKKGEMKIEVDQDNRVLKISGERRSDEEVEGDKWHRAERTVGKFWRQFRLPANADLDKIQARLENGVLKIIVPKLAEEKRRQPKLISIAEDEAGDKSDTQVLDVNRAKRDEM